METNTMALAVYWKNLNRFLAPGIELVLKQIVLHCGQDDLIFITS